MADTRVVSSRDLVRQESIQFIRPQVLTLTLIEARPNTKMYVFFGDTNVTHLCNLVGNTIGTDVITDSIGQAVIEFNLPVGTFNTGNYDITIADTNQLDVLETTGSVYGSAKSTFSANGTLQIYQTTQTTITTVTRVVPVKVDPLAQSFFTYGVNGGIFLSSIDIYFQTKDDTLPIRCEIREMVNGYPSNNEASEMNLVSVLSPSEITTSTNASVSSKFVFNPPIYLSEDSDYCFVLRSNSDNYNVFTSRMGEASFEDGRKIYQNPYTGSLFKSENNITWTAEQFEDIKFTINKAVFNTNVSGSVDFSAVVPGLAATGDQFTTTPGSNVITYTHPQEHGLEVGSKFVILTRTDDLYINASFNGIPYTEFNATHTVSSVIDRNTFQFQVTSTADAAGTLDSSGVVTYISVLSEGTNYTSSDTVNIINGGGSGATASLNVVDGQIKSVVITDSGTGYTSAPEVTITSTVGSGALLQASVLPTFTVYVNKPMNGFIPQINIMNFDSSKTINKLTTTIGNYEGGNLVTYSNGKQIEFVENYPYTNIDQNSLIASPYNETAMMGGSKSALVNIELITDNPNVSPVIDLRKVPNLNAYSYVINNQPGETISATASSGSVDSIVVTAVGSGYTVDPVVTISAPDLEDGVQATATAVRSGSTVSTINITEAGSGYTSTPLITITRGVGDITGAGAAAQAVLTEFNTELLPSGGNAKARYITRKTSLQVISTGVRLYAVISSIQGASVDWYIRTSLSGSGVVHEEQNWQLIPCPDTRNKSSVIGEFFEYAFELDNISSFDTYDLKCVMTAQDPSKSPIIQSYRVIVTA